MDIDIDFADREKALALFNHIRASRLDGTKLVRHNTGVYLHSVPYDPYYNLCSIPYTAATDYFKIDFLNVSIYTGVTSEEHLIKLMNTEPIWELLEHEEFTNGLFQVGNHHSILASMKPTSIQELAAVLAIIRPGKKHLIGESWNTILDNVWIPPSDTSYYFKKAHGIAYAVALIVQMNLRIEQLNNVNI